MNWVYIETDPDIYPLPDCWPMEGYEVLISDGIHYDVAYLVCSGGNTWIKVDVANDTVNDLVSFVPIKWTYIV